MSFKLTNIYITRPLNEAHEPNKYAIPEDILNGTHDDSEKKKAEEELNAASQEGQEEQYEEQPQKEMPEGEEVPQDDSMDAPQEEQPPMDDQSQDYDQSMEDQPQEDMSQDGSDELAQPNNNPDKDENGNDPTSVINDIEDPDDPDNQEFGDPNADPNADPNNQEYSQDDMGADSADMSMDDLNSEAQQTPGLRVLSSVTDQQYQLLNSELYDKFIHLKNRVKESISVDVDNLNPNTERLIQCKKIVSDNLHAMVNDIENFLSYTFNDTYESNVITYMKFMKRFQYALDIIDRIKHNKNH